jgi:hypothetical protein
MGRKRIWRLKILYLLLLILIGVSVLPLWFYGNKMMSMNREKLETQESVLQTTISRSLAQEISLYTENQQQQLKEFFDSAVLIAAQIQTSKYDSDPRLRAELEGFVTERPSVIYTTVLNNEARGVQAGGFNAASDPFLRKALDASFIAAHQGADYQSSPITI